MSERRRGSARLVARREVRDRIRGRVFRASTLLILVVVSAGVVIPVLLQGSTSHAQRVGVVGSLSAPMRTAVVATGPTVGTTVQLVSEASLAAAREELRSGRLALVILDSKKVVVNRAISLVATSPTALLARAVSRELGIAAAFRTAGLRDGQAATLADAPPLPVTSLAPNHTGRSTTAASIIGLILVFAMLTQYNTWTLIGVMEEKSTRVAEVLLAAIRPAQLLTGKVVGIGLVAFTQAALVVGFAVGLSKAVGSNVLQGTAPLAIVSTVVWLVLGYAFYSWVYAAAGSMAERRDQVQSMMFPLTIPIIFGYVISVSAVTSQNVSPLCRVLAYVPLTAPFEMPTLVTLGAVAWWQFLISAVISVACTAAVARFAVVIYRRAILRTGQRVRLRHVLFPAAR